MALRATYTCPVRILFLDIASYNGLLACVTEEKVLVFRPIDHRIGDHELVPLIEDALREAGWSYKDLTHLACVIGPGGFTSLRVGVSCINALSWALKIPLAGIHLSDLYAMRTPQGDTLSFLWLHSTKRTEIFVRGFGDFAEKWPQPTHITLDNLLSQVPDPRSQIPYVGELLPEHRTLIEEVGGVMLSPCPVSDVFPQFLSSLTYQTQILQPWYGRGW